ncbi:MAG: winged helix-turn-helix transcriptional regulator [Thermoplasmatota archaeon]
MTASERPLHPMIAISLAIVMTSSILISLSLQGSAETTKLLSKGSDSAEFFDLTFPEGGGRDPSVSIYIPNSGPVITSSLIISTVEGGPDPERIFVDVGSDERSEWYFGGGEEGRFGSQESFMTGQMTIRDRFQNPGSIYSLYLPEGADVHSSEMRISSPPTPEAEGLKREYRMEKRLLPVESVDTGDIDDDGELEVVYFDPTDSAIFAVDVEPGGNTSRIAVVEDIDGITSLTVIRGPEGSENGILFSRTENGNGSVELLIGSDLGDMKRINLSSGLPANSSGYGYNSATNSIYVLSGPSGRILHVTLGTGGDISLEEKMDSSIAGSAISEADLDGDGDKDLIVFPEVENGDNITICESNTENGKQVFSLDDTDLAYGTQGTAAVLDINGDGREEIYVTLGPHKRIASLYLDDHGTLSMNWIGLNNTDGRPRSLPRAHYGNGSIYQGQEGLLYISTYDGLYHVLPNDGPDSFYIWRKATSFTSLAILSEVKGTYKVASIDREPYLSTGSIFWSLGKSISIETIDGEVQQEVELGVHYSSKVDIGRFTDEESERPKKTTSSGNVLLRYDIRVQGVDGFLSLSRLDIDYDVSIDASNSVTFRPAIQKVIDISDLNDIPLTIRATSSGTVRVGPVSVDYDSPPRVLDSLPVSIRVREGASGTSLFNIWDHVEDDKLLPQGLDVDIVTGPDLPENMLFFDRNGNLVAQPFRFPDLNGEFPFAIRISDLRNTVQTDPIMLIVEPTQDPPVVNGGLDEIFMTEGEDQSIRLIGEGGFFSDPDGDELEITYTISNPQPVTLRETMQMEFEDGVLTLHAPETGTGGEFRLELLASDGSGENDPTLGVIKVNVFNREAAPYLGNKPGTIFLIEDQDTPSRIPLKGWFVDPDTHLSEYTFRVYSPSLLLDAYIRSTGGEPYLYLHPRGDLYGEFDLMLEMTGDSTNIMDRLTVNIVPVNDAPEVILDGKDLLENRGWLLNGRIRDQDSQEGIVEFRIGDGEWKRAWGFESWSFIIDFRDMESGSAFIFVRAFDGDEHSPVTYVKLTKPEPPVVIDPPVDDDDDDDDDDTPIKPPDDNSGIVPRSTDDDEPWLVYGGFAGILIAVILFFGFTEAGFVIMVTVGSSIYSKLSKKDILNHEVRGLIRGYIIANPGDHYSSIKRNLDLNNGTLAYHLRVLEQSGFIKSMYDGIYKRYYPSNVNISKLKKNVSKQEEIFNIILENPGVTMEEIGRMIGVSRQVVNYHVKNLIRAGVVSYLRDRKSAKFYPQDNGENIYEHT